MFGAIAGACRDRGRNWASKVGLVNDITPLDGRRKAQPSGPAWSHFIDVTGASATGYSATPGWDPASRRGASQQVEMPGHAFELLQQYG